MARPPINNMSVSFGTLDIASQVNSLNSLAEQNGYNFSVLKLVDVIDNLFTDISKMASELGNCQTRIGYIAGAVESTDSNLAGAWKSVKASMGNFFDKFGDMAEQIKIAANNYIQSTLDNELAAVTSTDTITASIDNINGKLDALFTEK